MCYSVALNTADQPPKEGVDDFTGAGSTLTPGGESSIIIIIIIIVSIIVIIIINYDLYYYY